MVNEAEERRLIGSNKNGSPPRPEKSSSAKELWATSVGPVGRVYSMVATLSTMPDCEFDAGYTVCHRVTFSIVSSVHCSNRSDLRMQRANSPINTTQLI